MDKVDLMYLAIMAVGVIVFLYARRLPDKDNHDKACKAN